ncbi:TVP38/TMEM64 family protein [Marinobacter sp. HL-58]|uniref:TVP38/TMEM64 family protein n=1 Tax=Marinobacter sp. HL-58 TaxID=1479237 RepID=UPI000480FEB0|nr:TVP38/TMEM64 family protein [Marinobacter sp. HL-58]KPP98893.1 MAG: hypothetical protein HLUCCO03_13750 [Marinobacter sp. HL-58]
MKLRAVSPLYGIVAGILLVAIVLAVLVYFDVNDRVVTLLRWFDTWGAWRSALFIAVMAVVVILLLPGALFTMGAGFVFGLAEGTVYVVSGTTLGAVLAFLIARYLFGPRARRYILARNRLYLFSEELARHGWKIVMLTRLIPFFPSKISNYCFGLTQIRLSAFTFGSLIGFVPYSLHNVYLGAIAADLSLLGMGEVQRTPLQWGLYGTGFIATVITIIYINRIARKSMARYLAQADSNDTETGERTV